MGQMHNYARSASRALYTRRRNIALAVVIVGALLLWKYAAGPSLRLPRCIYGAGDGFGSSDQGAHHYRKDFPKHIWQTTKDQETIDQWANKTATWLDMNPGWHYHPMNPLDKTSTSWVEAHFGHRPAIVSFWKELQVPILRADLLRYLAMLSEGGAYGDIDTSCLKPIDEWIPAALQGRVINALVGVEYDDTTYHMFVRPLSFCQWALLAKPGHQLFENAVRRVMYHLEYVSRMQRKRVGEIELSKAEVLEATGPGSFTDAVMEVLQDMTGEDLNYNTFADLREPTLFGDILILPINAFGLGQKHSHSGAPGYGEVLIRHHFGRSWYKQKPAKAEPKEGVGKEKKLPSLPPPPPPSKVEESKAVNGKGGQSEGKAPRKTVIE